MSLVLAGSNPTKHKVEMVGRTKDGEKWTGSFFTDNWDDVENPMAQAESAAKQLDDRVVVLDFISHHIVEEKIVMA